MKQILVTAESFGYGPIITCLHVIKKVKECINARYIFLGSGVSLEQAAASSLFDECIECNTFLEDDLTKHKRVFEDSDIVISSENIEGAKYAIKCRNKTFYIDNLFWMWRYIPKELYDVEAYFIAETLDCSENLRRLGGEIKNKVITGPLRSSFGSEQQLYLKDQLIINFGGAESFLIDSRLIHQYYCCLLDIILNAVKNADVGNVLVCGGSGLVGNLKNNFLRNEKVDFKTFKNDEYLQNLSCSKYIILSPGLGNYFEALSLGQRVMFVPPVNYSQYWQLKEYQKYDLGFDISNWCDYGWFREIERYADEEEGVGQVIDNVKLFLKDEDAQLQFFKKVEGYILRWRECYKLDRKRHMSCYQLNGIDKVVSEIIKRGA